MKIKIDATKELARLLMTAINDEIDSELLKTLKDPTYKHNLIPFEGTDEEKEILKKNWKP